MSGLEMTEGMNLPDKKLLTLSAAQRIVEAAVAEAIRNNVRVSVAVLDDGGHLLHFVRMDRVHAGTVAVADAKARAAVLFMKPTRDFAQSVAEGNSALLGLPGMLPFPGGIPLLQASQLVGGIGVSGAQPAIDDRIAVAGAAVLDA